MESHSGIMPAVAAYFKVMLLVVASTHNVHGQSCGGNLIGSGRFVSPNYPGLYPDDANCQWNLTADPASGNGSSISLLVEYLDLENHFDQLEVYSEGILMARYQESTAAHKAVFGRYVTVVFRSDSSSRHTGFSIFFNTTGSECGTSCTPRGCFVWTPNFPYPYPKGSKCHWSVDNGNGLIAFESTTVSATPFRGQLLVTSISSNGSQITDSYHSPAPIRTATILEQSVTVNFTSEGCLTGTGFLVFLAKKELRCGGHLVGQGTLSTPNYPGVYDQNTICVWQLTALQGLRVQLNVTEVNTELFHDYVRVYSDNQLVRSYSGTTGPFTLTLGSVATVEFQSDDVYRFSGLSASFISV